MTLRHPSPRQPRLKDFLLAPTRQPFARRSAHALIAAGALLVSACADGGYKMVRVTFLYSDQNRVGREQRAFQVAQDDCYFAGYEYAQPVGRPQIISALGPAGEYGGPEYNDFRETKSFYCVGAGSNG